MTPDEHMREIRRHGVTEGSQQHLEALLAMAKEAPGIPAETLRQVMREIADRLHPTNVEEVRERLRYLAGPPITHVTVILFKPSGKYYAEEEWVIPKNAIGPWDMRESPDFRMREGWFVLVPSQEPWGYPHLLMS